MGYPLHGCILGVIVCSPYYIETLKLWRAGHRLDHATRHWMTESNKTETENKDYDACVRQQSPCQVFGIPRVIVC